MPSSTAFAAPASPESQKSPPRVTGWVVTTCRHPIQTLTLQDTRGKVDHDRFAFLVALATLPTVGGARWGDTTPDALAGWAVRCIQVAVVLTYLLSVYAKVRFAGLDWVNSDKLLAAILRRVSALTEPLAGHPGILPATQYAIVVFELASPLLLLPGRIGRFTLSSAVTFHVLTFAGIGIMFWPHVVPLLSLAAWSERWDGPGAHL